MAAARVLIGIPELLREIASHIYAPASLSQLCLVDHAFRDAFTPQLYRCLRWDERNIKFITNPDRRRDLLTDNKLSHTKVLIITRSGVEALHSAWKSENPRKEVRWRHSDHYHYTGLEVIWTLLNDAIVQVCQHARGLQTFASQDMAICRDTAAALSSLIPSLQNISIEFHKDDGQILNVDTDATEQSLDQFDHPEEQFTFVGLRKLSLLVIPGDVRSWASQILQILLKSPDLEFLALSLSLDAALSLEYEPVFGDELGTPRAGLPDLSPTNDMFQWLSREYANATGHALQFNSTQFHWGTRIPNAIVAEGWANPNGVDMVYIWKEDNGPFLKGLKAFPSKWSDIGPQLQLRVAGGP
ncbi:hypothetical protein A1O3_05539 [Capronia epimyces CBS 606.96]|uniref:Uncharacterized protein n=1 Tax=Capronia epimyces CBS 606.96 TaxID=1182542 RepID=W9YRH6_9EURO|nr:uncharacterized protein A1O3_05539 [Capronia epimyces CBS 606.96]EXJ84864.1 hypothetical protein A1O3_05539 [Capronia epimyces CBS 606.96]